MTKRLPCRATCMCGYEYARLRSCDWSCNALARKAKAHGAGTSKRPVQTTSANVIRLDDSHARATNARQLLPNRSDDQDLNRTKLRLSVHYRGGKVALFYMEFRAFQQTPVSSNPQRRRFAPSNRFAPSTSRRRYDQTGDQALHAHRTVDLPFDLPTDLPIDL